MGFLYPSFLIALSALSIPVIVHLFNFRKYKKIYFTNVGLLKAVQIESKAKKNLKRLLILICRLFALASLVFAFAQPIIKENSTSMRGSNLIGIYIDNSFSMQAIGKNGDILTEAKRRAKELVEASSPSDRFLLLTNDFYNSNSVPWAREPMLEALEKINFSSSVRDISTVQDRLRENSKEFNGGRQSYLFSDFQKSTFSERNFKTDSLSKTNLVVMAAGKHPNVWLDTLFTESPYFQIGTNPVLHARIRNQSDKAIDNGSLKLYINGREVIPVSYNVPLSSSKELSIVFSCREPGIQQAFLVLEDYPITFDDTLFFSFEVNKEVPCLVINEKSEIPSSNSDFVKKLFSGDSLFSLTEQNDKNLDYGAFKKNNLIVLNNLPAISSGLSNELMKFVQSGGSLLMFPSRKADISSWNSFFNLFKGPLFQNSDTSLGRLSNAGLSQSFFEGVFEKIQDNMNLPVVTFHYQVNNPVQAGQESLLKLQNGESFLDLYHRGKGRIYVCSTPLEDASTNFARHAIFVPVLIRVAVLSRPSPPLYFYNRKQDPILVSNTTEGTEAPYHIRNPGKTDFIPEFRNGESVQAIYTHGLPEIAGNFLLTREDKNIAGLAFNYDRKESQPSCFSVQELEAFSKNPTWKNVQVLGSDSNQYISNLADISGGSKLWKYFIIAALLFLICEILLIKFMK